MRGTPRGFREVVDKHNEGLTSGKIEMVAELEGGGLQDQVLRAAAEALQAHPNLSAIFAINDPSALGPWTALNQVGKTEQVKVIGFDGQLEGKQAIKEGKIYADPIQFPEKMGTITAQNILKYLDGEPFEKVIYIPTELYRKPMRTAILRSNKSRRRTEKVGRNKSAQFRQGSLQSTWSLECRNGADLFRPTG